MIENNDIKEERRRKLADWRAGGDAYPNDFLRQNQIADLTNAHGAATRDALAQDPPPAAIAGRIMLRRRMGRATFFSVQDGSGRMQVYFNPQTVDEETARQADSWDLGDIIGAEGQLFLTKTGELTVRAAKLRLLAKCINPPPEKYHGISDAQTKYRQRYVSLLSSAAEREVFERRAAVIRCARAFLHQRGYMEVETPILQNIPGGALARPFVTRCNALDADFYLRIAQELHLKRLLVGGFERVFEMNKVFRNEGVSPRHNPEFTMLEFNAAYQTCEDFIELTEELLHAIVLQVTGDVCVSYQGQDISFARPFARVSPVQAILNACPHYAPAQLQARDFLLGELAKFEGERAQGANDLSVRQLQLVLFEKTAEHTLVQPTFLVDYPAEASPLARRNSANPEVAERFELFAAGRELVNGFSEINDPELQEAIFRQQAAKKDEGDDEAMHYDADYINALEYGLPPNAGGGVGIDRLVMLLTDQPSIRDVILFPQLRGD